MAVGDGGGGGEQDPPVAVPDTVAVLQSLAVATQLSPEHIAEGAGQVVTAQQAAGSGALHVPPEKAPFVVSVLHTFVFEQAQPSMVGNEAQVGGGGKSQ